MNKAEIDRLLPGAYQVLQSKDCGIAYNKNNELCINSSYRSQISSFGAAVVQGSLLSAIAYFSVKADNDRSNGKKTEVDRSKLIQCIFSLLKNNDDAEKNLFDYVVKNKGNEEQVKENILNAAIALKLAMNLYKLEKNSEESHKDEE